MNNLTGLRFENVHAIDLHSEPSVLFVEDRDVGLAKDDKEVSFAVVFQILSHMEVSAHAGFEHRYTNRCLRIAEQRKRGADVVRPHFGRRLPFRPCASAAFNPALVRSWMMERSN